MKTVERLEDRLMPCTPLNVLEIINAVNAGAYAETYDLNADGMVSPLDALLAINEANWRANIEQPGEIRLQPNGGNRTLRFSPCGESLSVVVLSLGVENPNDARVTISGEEYLPTEIGTLGKFQTMQFEVFGRGLEYLRVLGDFEDELLTLIVG
jgi:hypothetical protein